MYLKQYFVQRIDFQCNNNLPLFGWICAFCTKIHQHYPSIMQRYYRYRRESLGKFFTYFEKHFGFDYQLSLVPEGCIKITNQCTSSRPTSVIKFYFQPFPWCHFYHSMQDFYRSRWPRPRALRSGVIQSSQVGVIQNSQTNQSKDAFPFTSDWEEWTLSSGPDRLCSTFLNICEEIQRGPAVVCNNGSFPS